MRKILNWISSVYYNIQNWIKRKIHFYTFLILLLLPLAGIGAYYIVSDWYSLNRIDFEYLFRTLSGVVLILGFLVAYNQFKINSEKQKKEWGELEIEKHYKEGDIKVEPKKINVFNLDVPIYLIHRIKDETPVKTTEFSLTTNSAIDIHFKVIDNILQYVNDDKAKSELCYILQNGIKGNTEDLTDWFLTELSVLAASLKFRLRTAFKIYLKDVELNIKTLLNEEYLTKKQREDILYDLIKLNLIPYLKVINYSIDYPVYLPLEEGEGYKYVHITEILHSSIKQSDYINKVLKKYPRVVNKIMYKSKITYGKPNHFIKKDDYDVIYPTYTPPPKNMALV